MHQLPHRTRREPAWPPRPPASSSAASTIPPSRACRGTPLFVPTSAPPRRETIPSPRRTNVRQRLTAPTGTADERVVFCQSWLIDTVLCTRSSRLTQLYTGFTQAPGRLTDLHPRSTQLPARLTQGPATCIRLILRAFCPSNATLFLLSYPTTLLREHGLQEREDKEHPMGPKRPDMGALTDSEIGSTRWPASNGSSHAHASIQHGPQSRRR